MKTGFSLCEKLHREIPVLALYWPCTGLQCSFLCVCLINASVSGLSIHTSLKQLALHAHYLSSLTNCPLAEFAFRDILKNSYKKKKKIFVVIEIVLRNLQEQVNKANSVAKKFWSFTAQKICSTDLKIFAKSVLNQKSLGELPQYKAKTFSAVKKLNWCK